MIGTRRALLLGLICCCLPSPRESQASTSGPLLVRIYPSPETNGEGDLDWEVYDVAEVDQKTWLATQQGLYRLVGDRPQRLEAIKPPVFAVEDVDGSVWVGALEGLYRIRAEVIELVSGGGPVERVHALPDFGVFASTPRGALFFPWAEATGEPIPESTTIAGISSTLRVVARPSTEVWLGTLDTLYQLDAALQAKPVSAAPLGEVLFLEEWDGRIWFVVTDRGAPREGTVLTRLADGSIEPAFRVRLGNVTHLEKLRGVLYLGTNLGFYEVEKVSGAYDRKRLLERENNPINGLFETDAGHRYLVTDSRLYLQEVGGWLESPPPTYASPLHLRGGAVVSGRPLFWGRKGAFRLEPGGRIEVRFEGQLENGKLVVPSGYLKVRDVEHLDAQGKPLAVQPPMQELQLKVGFLRDDVQANGGGAGWVAARELNKELDCTRSRFYYLARDRWHNSEQGVVEFGCGKVNGAPWWLVGLIWLVGGISASFVLLLLALLSLILLSCVSGSARKLLSALLRSDKPAKLIRFLLAFGFLRYFPLCVYRRALKREQQRTAGSVPQAHRDTLLPLLARAVAEPRHREILPFPREALRPAVLAAMPAKGGAQAFAGWYPLFVQARHVKVSATDRKNTITSLFNAAVAVLEAGGELQGQPLAAALLEEGKFILIVQAADQKPAEQLVDTWPGEEFQASQTYLLVQIAGAGPDGKGVAQPSGSGPPPKADPTDPAAP